jgi:diguanylate cyclase (GGDEF)-like protein
MARAERVGTKVAVLLADIDKFKRINDTYGHLVGDAALREVARRMRDAVRPYDGVGRYGGDEFLVVLPGCDGISAAAVAERIRAACSAKPLDAGGHSLKVSLSFGGTIGSELMENEVEPILAAADASLYRAKADGRRVFVSRPGAIASEPTPGAVSVPLKDRSRGRLSPRE